MILIREIDKSQLKNARDQTKNETQTSLPRITSFKVLTFGLLLARNMIRVCFHIVSQSKKTPKNYQPFSVSSSTL